MKNIRKYASLILILVIFALPQHVFANYPNIKLDHMTQVDALAGHVFFGEFVCKAQPCDVNNETDWYNYSSEGLLWDSQETGEGVTLIASPGDTLSFLTEHQYTSDYDLYRARVTFNINFTNDDYLENISYFSGVNSNLDGDLISYAQQEDGSIKLDADLHRYEPVQLGAITATIKSDTPDGTIIEAILSADGDQFLSKKPLINTAYAASAAESIVKVLVRNIQPTSTPTPSSTTTTSPTGDTLTNDTQTLPQTGDNICYNIFLLLTLIIILSIVFIRLSTINEKNRN